MRVIIGNVRSPANPLLRAVSLIVGTLVLVGALFFGAILLVVAIGVAIVFGAVIAGRVWWLRRKFERAAAGTGSPGTGSSAGSPFGQNPASGSGSQFRRSAGARIIEGEFTDVSSDGEQQARSDAGHGRQQD
jgi:predicted lipid-binding transport protein (Tim44 family)